MATPEIKTNLTHLRHFFGIIEDSEIINGNIIYRVFLEGHHNSSHSLLDKATGVPIFFGEPNTYRLKDGTRVYCLVQISDMNTCYILGSAGYPDQKYLIKPLANSKNSAGIGTIEAGVYISNEKKAIELYSQSNGISINSAGVSINSNGKKINLGKNISFEAETGSIAISNNVFNLSSDGSMSMLSIDSYSLNSRGITLNSNSGSFKIKGGELYISGQTTTIGTGYFKLSTSLGSAFTPGSTTIDISALKGNIFIGSAMGNINMGLLSPAGTSGSNKYDFYIGTSQLKVASMNMTLSEASIALTPSGTFPVAALKSHMTIKIQEIKLAIVETPAGAAAASLEMGATGIDIVFGKAPGGTAGAKMSLGGSGASLAFGVSAAATGAKLDLGSSSASLAFGVSSASTAAKLNLEPSKATLHGSKIDLKAPNDKAPAFGVVTKMTDPIVDNITGAPHIGSMTVSASS